MSLKYLYSLQLDQNRLHNAYGASFALGDINGDKIDDIMFAPIHRFTGSAIKEAYPSGYLGDGTEFILPTQLILSDADSAQHKIANNQLKDDPGSMLARGVALGYFNTDSALDFVVVSSGMDTSPGWSPHGWYASLYLSQPDGTWNESRLEDEASIYHGVAVGDLNHDDVTDVFLTKRDRGDSILYGSTDGTFSSVRTLNLTGDREMRSLGALILDVDADSKEELLRFGDNGDTGYQGNNVWITDAKFPRDPQLISLKGSDVEISYLPPGIYGSKLSMTLAAVELDIDRDGKLDLILSQSWGRNSEKLYDEGLLQVFMQRDGSWIDESFRLRENLQQYLPWDTERWAFDLVAYDIDADGDEDLFVYGLNYTRVFINNSGYFYDQTSEIVEMDTIGKYVFPLDGFEKVVLATLNLNIRKDRPSSAEVAFHEVSSLQLDIFGTLKNDLFEFQRGEAVIDGQEGYDTIVLKDSETEFTLRWQENSWFLYHQDSQSVNRMESVEAVITPRNRIELTSLEHPSYNNIPDDLWFFFLVAFNAAPGVSYMDWMLDRTGNGKSIKSFVDVFVTAPQFKDVYPESMSAQQFATKLVANTLKGTAAAVYEQAAVDKILNLMSSGATRSDVIYNAIGDMKWVSASSPIWGRTAQLFENQKVVARFYTDVMSQSTTDADTLRSVVAHVRHDTDLSSDAKIIDLIGVSLLGNFDLMA